MKNPFKFGTVVSGSHFTNRTKDIALLTSVMNSDNHLVLISPRRYGKTSLVDVSLSKLSRPVIQIDMQLVTDIPDFAAQLLRKIIKVYPLEKIKQLIKGFRILPALSLNPVTNSVDVTFHYQSNPVPMLEDVLNLIEKLSSPSKKPIVVFDEFQDILLFDKTFDKKLRSVIQHHNNVNYIFLGSIESMMKNIFERKKSPFYHFGHIHYLERIPEKDLKQYLSARFKSVTQEYQRITEQVVDFTRCHPYYTQKMAFYVWENIAKGINDNCFDLTVLQLIRAYDNEYERQWNNLNRIDKKILIGLAAQPDNPLSQSFNSTYTNTATSTVFSGLKRLVKMGRIIKNNNKYEIDDPVFAKWIIFKREK